MAYTKEQLRQIEEIVTEKVENISEWTIDEIEETIFIEQVEQGEIEEENFYEAVTELGLPYIKKGRVPFEEVEAISPTVLEYFKNSSNPKSDIKDILNMKSESGVKKINDRIKNSTKIRERDKNKTIERNLLIYNELKQLANNKVKTNQTLMWSIYIIMRGRKRLERFNENGQDVELLKLQNSFINEETIDELKEMRAEYYEEQE